MKALVENKAAYAKSVRNKQKRSSMELSEGQLRRFKEALANPIIDEPAGVLAGASFKFSS
ncbi:hypothetical protein [Pseudomonas sp. GM48]|uniref:hypothetical protein n=1 Tax=Pseudomonas sp. GM48 TaxID=1144330 RepID=UPI00027030E8|nr:hypothetical protein [Pseudomonas sp. GM48]EJM59435.1 hypothetical protein PMI28_01789 [Pseudomonas sp. GM48]